MEHEGVESRMVISKVIEDLAHAEGKMQAARDKMNTPFLVEDADYASIIAYIDSALASVGGAIAEVHGKLHEP